MARRGGGGARLLVVLAVLAALVAAAVLAGNTVGRSYAEKRVAETVQAQAGLPTPPTVSIKDPMFVWSVIRQHVDRVDVAADRVPMQVAGKQVEVRVVGTLTDVRPSGSSFVAGGLTADATLEWGQIEKLTGYPLVKGPGNTVVATVATTILGQRVNAAVTARPLIDAQGRFTVTEPKATVNGVAVPEQLTGAIVTAVMKPIDLGLPVGLRATRVEAADGGLVLSLEGRDVDLAQLR